MSQVVIFDPNDPTVANRATQYLPSANTPDYSGNANALINPDLSALVGVIVKHWKRSGSSVVEMSQAEKDAIAQAESDALEESIREGAKAKLDGFLVDSLVLRAFADITKDEINILRAQHGLAPRTLTQLKTAIKNRIDDGSVD